MNYYKLTHENKEEEFVGVIQAKRIIGWMRTGDKMQIERIK